MRIRTIKPEFWLHEGVSELKFETRLLFIALWQLCDSQGRFEWREKKIKAQVFPYDFTGSDGEAINVSQLLHELNKNEFVKKYEAMGKTYGFIPSFRDHQRLSGKEASCQGIYPEPPENLSNFNDLEDDNQSGSDGEASGKQSGNTGTGNREEGKEEGKDNLSAEADASSSSDSGESDKLTRDQEAELIWKAYPQTGRNRSSMEKTRKAWKAVKANKRPSIEDVLNSIEIWKRDKTWREGGGQFVLALDRFIREHRWENPPEASGQGILDIGSRGAQVEEMMIDPDDDEIEF